MTDWSDVEFFAAPFKARKTKDFLPFVANILAVWDFLSCAAAGKLALAAYSYYVLGANGYLLQSGSFLRDILLGSFIAALILRVPSHQLNPRSHSTAQLVWLAERNCAIAFSALIAIGVATRATDDLARLWLLSWMAIFAGSVACTRLVLGWYLQCLQHRGELRETVAIIGADGARERMATRIADEADVVGLFAARGPDDLLQVGEEDELRQLLELERNGGLDSVILALERGRPDELAHVIERLKALPVQVAVCPDDGRERGASSCVRMLAGMPMTVVADRPIKRSDLLLKTVFDKTVALLLVVLLAPLLLGIAMGITATSPGPVIFRQRRRGWAGQDFVILKFRTMHCCGSMPLRQTQRDDPRCTSIGRFLRRSSLDELPQLWNVLRGDMSLVGPRPHAEALHDFDRAGREIVAEYAQRHRVKPGLTGWAQVNGARGATASLAQLRQRVEYDLYYIENWSLGLDLKILLQTPMSMMGESVF